MTDSIPCKSSSIGSTPISRANGTLDGRGIDTFLRFLLKILLKTFVLQSEHFNLSKRFSSTKTQMS